MYKAQQIKNTTDISEQIFLNDVMICTITHIWITIKLAESDVSPYNNYNFILLIDMTQHITTPFGPDLYHFIILYITHRNGKY